MHAWATGELEILRKTNDNPTSPEATAALRGQIVFVKRLIDLPNFLMEEAARDRAEPAPF